MAATRAHVVVSGRVQGVNFRDAARRQARALGVTGWVRNRADGRVEAVFEGEEACVRRMVEWCREGPPAARVDEIDVEWRPYTGEFDSFEVVGTWYW